MFLNVELNENFPQNLLSSRILWYFFRESPSQVVFKIWRKSNLFDVNDLDASYLKNLPDKKIFGTHKYSVTLWGVISKKFSTLTSLISESSKFNINSTTPFRVSKGPISQRNDENMRTLVVFRIFRYIFYTAQPLPLSLTIDSP